MKKLSLVLLSVLLLATGAFCQQTITAQGSTCATTGACASTSVGNPQSAMSITITGNGSGNTLAFEGLGADGVTWSALNVTATNATSAVTTTTSNNVTYRVNPASLQGIRVRCSTYVSGTVSVSFRAVEGTLAGVSGGGGGGITSINGDTTAAQVITGSGGVSATTSSGTTTITAVRNFTVEDAPAYVNTTPVWSGILPAAGAVPTIDAVWTNVPTMNFGTGTTEAVISHVFRIPDGYTTAGSSLPWLIEFHSPDTTHTATASLQGACMAGTTTPGALTFSNISTGITLTPSGTANKLVTATGSGTFTCADGSLAQVQMILTANSLTGTGLNVDLLGEYPVGSLTQTLP